MSCGCCCWWWCGGDGVASSSSSAPAASLSLLRMLNSSTAGGGGIELEPSSAGAAPPPDASAFSTDDSDEPESLVAIAAVFSGATSATFRSSSISSPPCDSCRSRQPGKNHLSLTRTKQRETAIDLNRSRVALAGPGWSISRRRTRGGRGRSRRVPSRSCGTFSLHDCVELPPHSQSLTTILHATLRRREHDPTVRSLHESRTPHQSTS